ncbi:hypothetical protein MRS44_018511 [Fusarium solani]|uniref:uncharacterized protein n=1 Tax=Fusarium solani TaxID=169388 RepID=UPI0032C40D8A|nr:hypothetical protein MRS44_018511 [Fusarium solani]
MAPFHSLIRFESAIDGQTYFADVGIGGIGGIESARPGLQLEGYVSIEDLIARNGGEPVTVGKVGAQLEFCRSLRRFPKPDRNTALLHWLELQVARRGSQGRPVDPTLRFSIQEAETDSVLQRPVTEHPSLWTKPAASLANPDEDIVMSKFCAASLPDYEGEGLGIVTRLNGQVVQEAKLAEDLVWKPAELLSWMSRSTTIPAGTAVMTGTPAGVAIFKQPRRLLSDGDIVEVDVPTLGTLRNKIIFE